MMSLLHDTGMTGDIWSTGAFAVESPLKDLLDSGNFTFEQLLAEDELLQELRGLHPQLLDYFSTEEAVTQMIRYLILDPNTPLPPEPSAEATEKEEEKEGDEQTETAAKAKEPGKWLFQHLEEMAKTDKPAPERSPENAFIRFPYMACEIICCELQGVINILVDGYVPSKTTAAATADAAAADTVSSGEADTAEGEEKQQSQQESQEKGGAPAEAASQGESADKEEPRQRILDLFLSVLYDTPIGELDDYRAGYLEKILSILFRKRPQALSEYINTGGGKGNVVLMKAMFKHLYSHSIMQLVQRLLLPTPQHLQPNPEMSTDADDGEEDGNLILGAPGMGGGGVIVEEADDESKTLHCTWSETGEGLDLLLQPLIFPEEKNGSEPTEEEQERRLNLCQNSSEVLITIIQNSPLNSQTMLRLTVDPIMEKLIHGASTLEEGADFGPHESTLTSTMNVLESLILQLGGYGSVGTISLLPTEEGGEEGEGQSSEQSPPPQFADLQALLVHIPQLLRSLSMLLQHPSCDNWRSPMQYSKPSEHQQLLGMSRLRIVRLLESLVLLGESNVDSLLCQSDCLEICLNLFWKFQWCSMLHQSVANLLVHVFEGANARSEMQEYFLVKCNLLGRLMDSFAEAVPSPEADNAAMPDFTEQELVIAMKDIKMGVEGTGVNAPQPNDLGVPDDGVGVPSEDIIPVSDDDVDAVLEQQVEQQEAADAAAAAAAAAMVDLADGERLKEQSLQEDAAVSVGQVSTEAVRFESRDTSTVGAMQDGAPAQSFRLGYMGHVIIICQALVHACSSEGEEELEATAPESAMGEDDDRRSLLTDSQQEDGALMNGEHQYEQNMEMVQPQSMGSSENPDMPAGRDDGESARGSDSNAEGIPPPNPLMLSKLIDSHPLRPRWQEFVKSTLATETAIQSTPLGGFNNQLLPGADPLHAHRPLGDGDDFDDGSGQPNMPPRGMLGGGEMIDMDDNDLDIAASMMAGLHLARGPDVDEDDDDDDDSSDDGESDGSGHTYDSGEKKGYFYDDPLGGKQSGLGLALGNLGQYHANNSDEDNNSDGSSEDEGEPEGPRRTTSSGDVPVMNLFAGNFGDSPDKAGEGQADAPFDEAVWSNFANFDDAFAGASSGDAGFTADFGAADIASASDNNDPFPAPSPSAADMDDIFGGIPATHAILLDDSENDKGDTETEKNDSDPFATNDKKEGLAPFDEETPA